jgi:hypothetical protein
VDDWDGLSSVKTVHNSFEVEGDGGESKYHVGVIFRRKLILGFGDFALRLSNTPANIFCKMCGRS